MLALLLIALVGTTILLVRGTVFGSVRRLWPALLSCAQCAGTWVGAAAGASGLVTTGHGRALDAAILGAAISIMSFLADALLLNLLGEPEE